MGESPRRYEMAHRKISFNFDMDERLTFSSENTSARGEMYHCSPEEWRRRQGLDIKFPEPTPEQIKRARKDYEEFIDIP